MGGGVWSWGRKEMHTGEEFPGQPAQVSEMPHSQVGGRIQVQPQVTPGHTRLQSRGKELRSLPGLPCADGRLCRALKASSKGIYVLCAVTHHDRWSVPKRQILESFNVILFEKRVFAGIITLRILT